jgi:AraC-like DNA-binding protein
VEVVERAGVPPSAFFDAAGIRPDQLDADIRVPRSELDRICELAIDVTGDPALGLHWAEKVTYRTFGPMSQLPAYSMSLRHALELLSRFGVLFCDEPLYELLENADKATIRMLALARLPGARRLSAEMMVSGFVRVLRSCSRDAKLDCVSFEYAAPAYHAEYARVFGPAVHFDQPFTGIVFDRALLDSRSPNSAEDMHAALTAVAERRMQQLTLRAPPYAHRVRELLVSSAPARITMSTVATALGLSTRSLHRRLSSEGTSYLEIEYDALASLAKRMLRDKQYTIQQTAYEMGFADAASFHRAFKRWTGETPSAVQAGASRKRDP